MGMLIRNGEIVTSSGRFKADIALEGEKIVSVGQSVRGKMEEVIDAAGKLIFPGGVDGHTHFALPFMGTTTAGFETTSAAVLGGTTTVIDFAPQPEGLGLVDSVIKHLEEEAEGKAAADFGLHAMLMDPKPTVFEELPRLVEAGVPTIKLYTAYKGTPLMSDDAAVFKMLQKTKEVGMLMMLHAENGHVIEALRSQLASEGKLLPKHHAVSRPVVAEREAAIRATLIAKAAEAPIFIVHISCAEAMAAVRQAQTEGIAAYGETCPHYLVLDVNSLDGPGFEGAKYVCSPPLREPTNQDPLWASLQHGWLQVVGSDHCGFNYKGQKEMGLSDFRKIPNGMPGVGDRLSILYTFGVLKGKLTLERMIDVFATAPAKFYGLYPQKGSIAPGADADIVIFDPDYRGKFSAKGSMHGVDYSPFEGLEQRGRPDKVFLRGRITAERGVFTGRRGQGKYLKRNPYGLAYAGM